MQKGQLKTAADKKTLIRNGALLGILAFLCFGCSPKVPGQKPQQIVSTSKPLVVELRSTPSKAEVYRVNPDQSKGEKLGRCPMEITEYEIGKEEWRFAAGSAFPKEKIKEMEGVEAEYYEIAEPGRSEIGTSGSTLQLKYIFEKEGYDSKLFVKELNAEELRTLWENPRLTCSVELKKK